MAADHPRNGKTVTGVMEGPIWAARLYLQRFAYRVEGYGWVFLVAVLISLAIAFGTVLWQTLKAARTNPAVELKKE